MLSTSVAPPERQARVQLEEPAALPAPMEPRRAPTLEAPLRPHSQFRVAVVAARNAMLGVGVEAVAMAAAAAGPAIPTLQEAPTSRPRTATITPTGVVVAAATSTVAQ